MSDLLLSTCLLHTMSWHACVFVSDSVVAVTSTYRKIVKSDYDGVYCVDDDDGPIDEGDDNSGVFVDPA